jgi:hypothetical protein
MTKWRPGCLLLLIYAQKIVSFTFGNTFEKNYFIVEISVRGNLLFLERQRRTQYFIEFGSESN